MTLRSITVGTRGSALAQWQTQYVCSKLQRLEPDLVIRTRIYKTEGDLNQTRPLAELGGLGVFTKTIQDALLAGEIDLAVHSLKDLPTLAVKGLIIAAIPEREDPRDCLVSKHGVGLMQLPPASQVGTSSARRSAQIRALRPDLQVIPLRGNVDTRLRKSHSPDYDGVILASAGVTRLGRAGEITEYFAYDQLLPDPGQGALAVEVRSTDAELVKLVAKLDHKQTRAATDAERAFLRALGGGCRMPIGAHAEVRGDQLELDGVVAALDGSRVIRARCAGNVNSAESVGTKLATQLLLQGASQIIQIAPLRDKRILITRAREQAHVFADKIRSLGGEPVEFPTIDFAPLSDWHELDAALAQAKSFDWIVFTSANGVRAVVERMQTLGLGMDIFQSAKIAAIGPASANALQDLDLNVDFIPSKFLGEQIAIELPVAKGSRVLLLRADLASNVLARGLAQRGMQVTDIDAYRTILAREPLPSIENIDAITFTSSSTVRNFVELAAPTLDRTGLPTVFCIGPVTAGTARELGIRVDAESAEHTIDGLIATMVQYYSSLRPETMPQRDSPNA